MTAEAAPRIRVTRTDRPLAVIAELDARVIRHELERRLGPVTLDLRIDSPSLGPWASGDHVQGPADVDAELDPTILWSATGTRPANLFARTVEPEAAVPRRAMLRHLAVIPDEPFVLDDACLARLDPDRVRPTDLWLVATAAADITVADVDVVALGTTVGDDAAGPLDIEFDRVAAALADLPASQRRLARVLAERDELRERLVELEADLRRDEADLGDRLAALERELAVWRERTERAELGVATRTTPGER